MPARRRSRRREFCVLVIDDDRDARRINSMYLRTKGWVVFSAASGRMGIKRAKELSPDVIILDLGMRHIDGWTTLKHLRGARWAERMPIVILTATEHARDEAFQAGCDAYLTKPCPPEVLFLQIAALMRLRPGIGIIAQPHKIG